MTREEIKEVCVDEWVFIGYNGRLVSYYKKLGYQLYQDYDNKKYFIIHPWDLLKESKINIIIKCPKCFEFRNIEFRSIFKAKTLLCKSCSSIKDLSTKKFGRLTVLKDTGKRSNNHVVWECLCICGNITEVLSSSLLSGNTRSCGCLQREAVKNNSKAIKNWHKSKNHFIKADHTEEEYLVHLHNKNRSYDTKEKVSRKERMIQDNYTCQISGIKGVNLNIHHLNAYSTHIPQRYLQSNLITLTKEIHKEFHKIYTNYSNTVEQFYEFYCLKARN